MQHYYDISPCHIEQGFITFADAALLSFSTVGKVAIVTGAVQDAAVWADRIGAILMDAAQTDAFLGARLAEKIVAATQARLDAFAQTRNYDSILSACTYATSSIPRFAAEGQAAVDARDATWATLYTLMGEVQAGTRQMPPSFSEVELLLPALAWPV